MRPINRVLGGAVFRRICSLVMLIAIVAAVMTSVPASYAASSGPVPVPTKFVGGYLENWISTLPRSVPSGYGVLFSAFATINSDGSVSYSASQDVTNFTADIVARRVVGKPTILSVGGAGGAQSGLATSAQQAAFLSSVQSVIDAYGFSGIDWDIEAETPMSAPGMAAISRSLVARYGANFAITMAPYGQTEAVYKQLASSIRDIVTFVGFQFYNDNAPPTSASVLARMDGWIRDTGITPSQFSIGFMPRDDGGKVTSYSSMVSIYNAVNAKYPTVRGVWDWAVGSDQGNGYQFVNTLAPVVGSGSPAAGIAVHYQDLGGPASFLGTAVTADMQTRDGVGHFTHYQHGSIYWSPASGAWEVHGAIRDLWSGRGWEIGFLHYPVTDEMTTPDGVGRVNHFQGGTVYWTPSTWSHEVHGAIRDAWAAGGWERGFLGYPVTNEMTTPDGVGRFNHFQGGSVYWTPSTWSHA